MKRSLSHILIVGFALFSMLFGAGNVIFPPYLGLSCGPAWLTGFIYYYLADIALALICLFAIQKSGGHRAITGHLGVNASEALTCMIILCIGPMLGIPRTAAAVYEMSVIPMLPGTNPVIFSVVFFLVVALLCLNESSVVDIIGKLLTPFLITGLLIMIIKGILHPIGAISETIQVINVPVTGIQAGYQTMDVLAIVIFGILISKTVREKGYTDQRSQTRIVAASGLVAGISLLLIYMGLTYLGASASSLYDTSIDHTMLVISIVRLLLGHSGTIIFAVVVSLACLTTAVALVSSCSDYFSTLSKGWITYRGAVVSISLFSAIVTNFGLNRIISIAAPILDIVYPPTLLLILLSFFSRYIPNEWVYRLGTVGATAISILNVITRFGLDIPFLQKLPLYDYGFNWVLPAAVGVLIGFLIPRKM